MPAGACGGHARTELPPWNAGGSYVFETARSLGPNYFVDQAGKVLYPFAFEIFDTLLPSAFMT